MKKVSLIAVSLASIVYGCASETSTSEDTISKDSYSNSVIESIAKAPDAQSVEQPVTPPVTPPIIPPTVPPEKPEHPEHPEQSNRPTVVPPERGEGIRIGCGHLMSDEVKSIATEDVIHDPKTNTVAIRWKLDGESWVIYVLDEVRKGPPRCRRWTNDAQGTAQEF